MEPWALDIWKTPDPDDHLDFGIEETPNNLTRRFRAEAQGKWKKDLQSFRATCYSMSQVESVNLILFHDFQLYVTETSLDRFEALSKHEYGRYVRRVAFMVPQVEANLCDQSAQVPFLISR